MGENDLYSFRPTFIEGQLVVGAVLLSLINSCPRSISTDLFAASVMTVSSAYTVVWKWSCGMDSRSIVSRRNRIGQTTDPCDFDRPLVILTFSESAMVHDERHAHCAWVNFNKMFHTGFLV